MKQATFFHGLTQNQKIILLHYLICFLVGRAARSLAMNVPKAHAGGKQAENGAVVTSAGAPGEAGSMIACGYYPSIPCM